MFLLFLALTLGKALYAQVDVLTAQYHNNRTSSSLSEQILTTANVNSAQFGGCSPERWTLRSMRLP